MANEIRVRQNFLGGLVENNPLASTDTTLSSTSLAAMIAVGSTQHLPIVLDQDGRFGDPEIVYVTAHTAGATTATIARAQEGSIARAHIRDVPWVHGPILSDFPAAPLQVTGTTTLTALQFTAYCTAGGFTVTLPTAPIAGQVYVVKNLSTAAVTVASSANIDGASTFVLTNQYDSISVIYTGTTWMVI